MNPVLDEMLGGWQLSAINTANTGTPMNVYYYAFHGERRNRADRGVPRARRSCGPTSRAGGTSQSTAQSLLTYFAACTFTTPPANAPFGNLGRNAFRAPSLEQWDLGGQQELPHH